jgi:hypothetical protein
MTAKTPASIGDPFERARQGQIGGRRRAQDDEREEAPAPAAPAKEARISRTYYLRPDTARRVKTFAVTHDTPTSDVVNAAIEEYLRRREGQ